MRCHCVPFGPFLFHSANKQIPVGYWFYFYYRARNILHFYENIGAQSSISRKNKVKVMRSNNNIFTLECQLCFRNNKICEFDTLERQTMGVNKYARTFLMASYNKERCNHRKKTWRKKIWKYAIVFASTQLRITRLRKYPIDPKAYLGRWITIWTNFVRGFISLMLLPRPKVIGPLDLETDLE